MVKVWLLVFLVQFPNTGVMLPVYKTVPTEDDCMMHIMEAFDAARSDGIPIRGTCTEYDGVDEEGTAMEVTLMMIMKEEKK